MGYDGILDYLNLGIHLRIHARSFRLNLTAPPSAICRTIGRVGLGPSGTHTMTFTMNLINFRAHTLYADTAQNYAMGFQDPASSNMLGIIELHDKIMFYLIIIFVLVTWLVISLVVPSLRPKDNVTYLSHGNSIEIIWTVAPAMILWAIGIPSISFLYQLDEILSAELTIKATGFQWGWNYSYGDYSTENEGITFDSYMVGYDDLEEGDLRQLTVDNYLVLPVNTSTRVLLTSNDVIHSFTVPSLGVKCDALPGRLNTVSFIINRLGTYYGQCSELCGVLHSGMPIGVKAVSIPNYLLWVQTQLESNN